MSAIRKLLLMPLLAIGITAFSTDSAQSQTPARDQLVADLQGCTKAHGYDPANTAGLGAHELGPNELPWRECAYDAVRRYEQTNPALSSHYDQLINEDITMTNAVQGGSMTRAQRRERLEVLIAQIEEAEKNHVMTMTAGSDEETKKVRQVVDGVRGFY
jgi:hypothetical protein